MSQPNTARPWWKIYTPRNVLLESVSRLKEAGRRVRDAAAREKPFAYDATHAGQVGGFYDDHHAQFLRVYGPVIQAFRTKDVGRLLDYQAESMGLRSGQKVLDAGCGVGAPALYFARHAGVSVDAITISQKQFEAAVRNVEAEEMGRQVKVVRGDYHRLPDYFVPGSYDVIYFLESFGHSRAKAHLLDVCWTMLKPGGLLYVKDLFKKVAIVPQHKKKIDAEVLKINEAYRYDIADLNAVLDAVRRKGYVLTSLKTIDLNLSDFENLSISNEFQELTGIARIENWEEYVFPVEFFELKCVKPVYDIHERPDRYFLQTLYYRQAQHEQAREGTK